MLFCFSLSLSLFLPISSTHSDSSRMIYIIYFLLWYWMLFVWYHFSSNVLNYVICHLILARIWFVQFLLIIPLIRTLQSHSKQTTKNINKQQNNKTTNNQRGINRAMVNQLEFHVDVRAFGFVRTCENILLVYLIYFSKQIERLLKKISLGNHSRHKCNWNGYGSDIAWYILVFDVEILASVAFCCIQFDIKFQYLHL